MCMIIAKFIACYIFLQIYVFSDSLKFNVYNTSKNILDQDLISKKEYSGVREMV